MNTSTPDVTPRWLLTNEEIIQACEHPNSWYTCLELIRRAIQRGAARQRRLSVVEADALHAGIENYRSREYQKALEQLMRLPTDEAYEAPPCRDPNLSLESLALLLNRGATASRAPT